RATDCRRSPPLQSSANADRVFPVALPPSLLTLPPLSTALARNHREHGYFLLVPVPKCLQHCPQFPATWSQMHAVTMPDGGTNHRAESGQKRASHCGAKTREIAGEVFGDAHPGVDGDDDGNG